MEKDLNTHPECDILNSEVLSQEDDEMISKFYNFNCIILYGYIDRNVALDITNNRGSINTPFELYETPYIAQQLATQIQNKQLMAFAVHVQSSIYDELDIGLDNAIKKSMKSRDECRKSVAVVRRLKQYKAEGKKSKPYISYTIQNTRAIAQCLPM